MWFLTQGLAAFPDLDFAPVVQRRGLGAGFRWLEKRRSPLTLAPSDQSPNAVTIWTQAATDWFAHLKREIRGLSMLRA